VSNIRGMGEPPSHDQTVPFILDTIPSGDDSVPAAPLEGEGFVARYTQVGTIGEGGMGVALRTPTFVEPRRC
jgi:hypothetical protein